MKSGHNNKSYDPVLLPGQGYQQGECFRNRFEALQWMQSRGKISTGKFYQDCKAGLVTIYPDKSVSKFSVAMYAEDYFSKFVRKR